MIALSRRRCPAFLATAFLAAARVAGPAEAQEVVESAAPRDGDLTLAEAPLARIGILDGPLEYVLGNVTGAVRTADGGIAVADEQSFDVRKYDASGRHVWTSGRAGEGPGEYRGLRLLRNCPGAPLTVFDWSLDRITELDSGGNVLDTRALNAIGVNPYSGIACSPDGRLVFTPWPEDMGASYEEGLTEGDHYRWHVDIVSVEGDVPTTLRSGIPGAERTYLQFGSSRPREWGRDMKYTPAGTGVWHGSTDGYELEHVDWTGRITRTARWRGPSLEVTDERTDIYRDAYLAMYEDPDARRRFERRWPDIRDSLPERFPAYEALLALPDGAVWVKTHGWLAPGEELHLLGADGAWLRRLILPGGVTVLDIGRDWALLLERDELGVQSVTLYDLVPR